MVKVPGGGCATHALSPSVLKVPAAQGKGKVAAAAQ